MKSHALASFWQRYEELPERTQRLAKKNFALFKTNPRHPSLGFQKRLGAAAQKGRAGFGGWLGAQLVGRGPEQADAKNEEDIQESEREI